MDDGLHVTTRRSGKSKTNARFLASLTGRMIA